MYDGIVKFIVLAFLILKVIYAVAAVREYRDEEKNGRTGQMRLWREIFKDDDARAAILAVAITMAIALLIVGCVGVGCYGVYKIGTVIFSCEDPQHVTADHSEPLPRFRFNNETRAYVTDDTVRKHYRGPGGFKMNIEEIVKTDSVTLRFIWSPDSVGGAEWMQLTGFINADSTPLVFSLKPKKIGKADSTKKVELDYFDTIPPSVKP